MTKLLVVREYLKHFYSRYEIYIQPVWKLLLAFISLTMINSKLGYMSRINNAAIVLVAALMCSFLPTGCIVLFSALFILLHLYALSLECALVVGMVIMVMFLLYFRFTPKDTIVLLLTPISFVLKVPYIMPLSMGLVSTPASVISVGCGTIVYYFLAFINENAPTINVMEDDITTKFRYLIDGLINNKAMIVTVAAFAITLIIVYLIRRMSIDHSWTIAMIAGTLVNVVMLLIGDLMYDTNVSIVGILTGGAVSLLLAKVLQFFVFSVDYNRTERVQFEDDEYYYYVKAVPKLSVSTPAKTVKKINTQKSQSVPAGTAPRTVNTVNSSVRNGAGTSHTAGASRTVGNAEAPRTARTSTTGTVGTTARTSTLGTAAGTRPVRTVNTVNTGANRTSVQGSGRSSSPNDK